MEDRELDYTYTYTYKSFSLWGDRNDTNETSDFDFSLRPAQDVSVDTVVTSLYYNTVVFVFLMTFYECLRRLFPAVYSSRKRLTHRQFDRDQEGILEKPSSVSNASSTRRRYVPPTPPCSADTQQRNAIDVSCTAASLSSLPDDMPLDWVAPVFGVPWSKVRKTAGLDGYFFLRYIRMNIRITAVSSFWFFLILVPIYSTGGGNQQYGAQGWYHISAANLPSTGWRMWAPCVFAYLFSAFIFFVIKQEYRHYLELRQDFLARGSAHVNPQHHYSLMIEDIPENLRSDRALKEYFENLFPGRVHSASVILKLPDLEEAALRCMRMCRRLEKSIAYLHATGKRPTHIVGRGRLRILGVDLEPVDFRQCVCNEEAVYLDDDHLAERPEKGLRVDSISYYIQDLAAQSRALFRLQKHKESIADTGNQSIRAETWLDQVVMEINAVANQIMDDSNIDNDLICASESMDMGDSPFAHADNMTSQYGSINPMRITHRGGAGAAPKSPASAMRPTGEGPIPLIRDDHLSLEQEFTSSVPFGTEEYSSCLRRFFGRLGLDFAVAIFRLLHRQLDVALEGVISATMSSTGFVTFLDLSSTTCAASALLSPKASCLTNSIAPEPREIIWANCQVPRVIRSRREQFVNVILILGVILWSFPLAAIQAFAKAQFLAQIPGMEWIETFHDGALLRLANGYLPVVALLGLIMLLPIVFEYTAVHIECRKTYSDVQASMLTRYFYYQLANIYITVTAGSLLKSLADILDHPSYILPLLGESLPTMVGYFVALLVTKIMAGLPMIFIRFGALSRMLFLKTLSDESKLTQRELDAVYCLENVQYGWEFPTQLLVVVIVFTYAIICPIILPVGLVYFVGALVVYKKQVLYVYSPLYESGGAMFPLAVQRTIFGLVCGQMTLLGYTVTRAWYYQNLALVPLPIMTVFAMKYFRETYVEPSNRLSLERAREFDRFTTIRVPGKENTTEPTTGPAAAPAPAAGPVKKSRRELEFDKNAYRQPVLTQLATEPWTYRRGIDDEETLNARQKLRQINRFPNRHELSESPSP